jgi:hypothetical protein
LFEPLLRSETEGLQEQEGLPGMDQPSSPIETTDSSTADYMNPDTRRTIHGLLKINTAADRLPAMFQFILTRGKLALPAFLGGYMLLVFLWLPFWGLSFLVSEYGVYMLCVGTIFFVGRIIIR